MQRIYLDHSATTPLDIEVLEKMIPYFSENFGNASSLYREGQIARESIDDARLSLSKNLGCFIEEIIFTSGATESNNFAVRGVVESFIKNNPGQKPHIIISSLEHSSVLSPVQELEDLGIITVSRLSVDEFGIIDIEELKSEITPQTALVSIMAVNNEIGSVQPLARIGRLCSKHELIFHVDAVQAAGVLEISMENWKADMISLSAHKFYGPKGVGLLAIKSGTEICAQVSGGGQERSYRAGTENVAGIVGMQYAFEKAEELRDSENIRLQKLQEIAKEYIEKNIEGAIWNGPEIGENRSSMNVNFSIPGISGESLLMRLDLEGVSLSLGSACSAGMMKASHVLLALGRTEEEASSGIRISMGRTTTKENLLIGLEKIAAVAADLKSSQEFF